MSADGIRGFRERPGGARRLAFASKQSGTPAAARRGRRRVDAATTGVNAVPEARRGRAKTLGTDGGIDLTPSGNHVSARTMEVQAAQGGTCAGKCTGAVACTQCRSARIDECIAIERVKKLFGAAYASVRPHSDAAAIAAVHAALLEQGDSVLMPLGADDGLWHRCAPGGKAFKTVAYRLKAHSGEIDYAKLRALTRLHKPRVVFARYSEVCQTLHVSTLRTIADEVGAYLHIDVAHVAGLIAAGLYPNPVAVADVVTAATDGSLRGLPGGVILARFHPELEDRFRHAVAAEEACRLDGAMVAAKAQTFKEALDAGFVAYQCRVIANARAMLETFAARGHAVAGTGNHDAAFVVRLDSDDSAMRALSRLRRAGMHADVLLQCPVAGSGIRIGASAITTRGFALADAAVVATLMCDLLEWPDDAAVLARVRKVISRLCKRYPVPAGAPHSRTSMHIPDCP